MADKTFWDTIATTKAPIASLVGTSACEPSATLERRHASRDHEERRVVKSSPPLTTLEACEAQAKDRDAAVEMYLAKKRADGQPITYLDEDHVEREWLARTGHLLVR